MKSYFSPFWACFLLVGSIAFFAVFFFCRNKKDKEIIFTSLAPKPIGPYNQAIKSGNLLFISGQIALNQHGKLDTSDIKSETMLIMQNLNNILDKSGLGFKNVVKTTIYLTDMNDFSEVNKIYGKYFQSGDYPARETVGVVALPKGVHVEISMIAAE